MKRHLRTKRQYRLPRQSSHRKRSTGDEEVVAPTKRRGKRKPLPADLPRIEVVHELPKHELTCACGCRKHAIGEEVSEQLEIVPMQIRIIKQVYGCPTASQRP